MSYIIGEEYYHLEPENHVFSARDWHGKYKLDCFKMFGFTCWSCDKKISLSEGVVHHKTYKHKGGIYQARPHEIKDKICLMCHDCHKKEHQSTSIDGITKILPKIELHQCVDCGEAFEDANYLLSNGRCEPCNVVHEQTMSEYIF